jgi:hypothetical protein
MKKLNIMKNLIFTLALLVSFGSFGQLDSNGNEYNLTVPMLEFEDNSEISKENLMKELKCLPVGFKGRKYRALSEVTKKDLIPKVVSFDVSITGQESVAVKGNSIGDSPAAKNLLDKAKVGDYVVFSNILGTLGDSPNTFKIQYKVVIIK